MSAEFRASAAIVVMGVSGAGKSTVGQLIAARLDCPFRDADSFHPPANIAKMSSGQPLTDEDRWPWLRAIAAWIAEHRAAGTTCVVTCSALKRVYRDIVTDQQRADVRLVYLKGDFDLIAARLAARKGHFMPPGAAQEPVRRAGGARRRRARHHGLDRRNAGGDRRARRAALRAVAASGMAAPETGSGLHVRHAAHAAAHSRTVDSAGQ